MDKIIIKKKPKLISWLKQDANMILQYVQSRELVTDSEYDRLKSIRDGEEKVTELLDIILPKGEKMCGDFLKLLQDNEVNEFSPDLREWINTVDTSGLVISQENTNTRGPTANQVPSRINAHGSNVNSVVITGSNTGPISVEMNGRH